MTMLGEHKVRFHRFFLLDERIFWWEGRGDWRLDGG